MYFLYILIRGRKMKNFYAKENIMEVLNNPKFSDFSLSQKGALADIVSNVVNEIMYSERADFLSKTDQDKGNRAYQRDLQTSFGKLSLNVPRTRNSDFRHNVLPDKYTRFDSSFESLVNSLLVNGDSKNEIISKLKEKGKNVQEIRDTPHYTF